MHKEITSHIMKNQITTVPFPELFRYFSKLFITYLKPVGFAFDHRDSQHYFLLVYIRKLDLFVKYLSKTSQILPLETALSSAR